MNICICMRQNMVLSEYIKNVKNKQTNKKLTSQLGVGELSSGMRYFRQSLNAASALHQPEHPRSSPIREDAGSSLTARRLRTAQTWTARRANRYGDGPLSPHETKDLKPHFCCASPPPPLPAGWLAPPYLTNTIKCRSLLTLPT